MFFKGKIQFCISYLCAFALHFFSMPVCERTEKQKIKHKINNNKSSCI